MEHDESPKSSSWRKRLSVKLRGTSNDRKSNVQDTKVKGSPNPFARNYIPPEPKGKAPIRSANVEPDRTNPDPVYQAQAQGQEEHATLASNHSIQTTDTSTAPTSSSSRSTTTRSSIVQDVVDDDFIGLDMYGRARRRSSAAARDRPSSSKSTNRQNPFARNHVPPSPNRAAIDTHNIARPSHEGQRQSVAHTRDYVAPPPGQLIRKSHDYGEQPRSSKEHSRLSALNPFHRHHDVRQASEYDAALAAQERTITNQSHTRDMGKRMSIPRKEVPRNQDVSNSKPTPDPLTINTPPLREDGTDLGISGSPIYAEFTHKDNRTKSEALNEAHRLLDDESYTGEDAATQTQAYDLERRFQQMDLQTPELQSQASFSSAHERLSGEGLGVDEDVIKRDHPTAEQIVERAQYNSTDTTVHERVAPAVTHEIVQPKVHEIVEEQITREHHHYHQIHRILPVHDVEILPAKHYRLVNGVQVEMKPEEVPQSRIDAWNSTFIPATGP